MNRLLLVLLFAGSAAAQTKLLSVNPGPGKPLGTAAAGGIDGTGDGIPDLAVTVEQGKGFALGFSGKGGAGLYTLAELAFDGPAIASWTQLSLAVAGDYDGDGVADWILGVPEDEDHLGDIPAQAIVYSGASGAKLQHLKFMFSPASGYAVSGSGDMNGDGFADILVASGPATWFPAFPTKVLAYAGPSAAPLYTWTGSSSAERFGSALASAGDIDLDGRGDALIGAPGGDYAQVRSGATGAVLHTLVPAATGQEFGAAVAGAGDVNGDGIPDLLVGAPGASKAYLFSGRTGALLRTFTGNLASDFGRSVAAAGDVDGDGRLDQAIGAPNDLKGSMTVYSGLDGSVIGSVVGAFDGAQLGRSVAGAGDLNQDGRADVLALSPGKEPPGSGPIGELAAFSFAPGLAQSGAGTPGCSGAQLVNATAVPKLGTPAFALTTTNAPASSVGIGLVTDAAQLAGADPFGLGVQLYGDFAASTELLTFDAFSDASGFGVGNPIAIPNVAAFAGTVHFVQTLWVWPALACTPSPFGLSTSVLLTVTVQP